MAKSIWRTKGDMRAATVWATLSTTLGCSRMILRTDSSWGTRWWPQEMPPPQMLSCARLRTAPSSTKTPSLVLGTHS